MTINVNCPPRGLFIGHETENAARALTVDFSAWAAEYSTGTLQILFQRPGTESPYAVVLTRDGTTATWKPSETDLAEAGTGAVQIIYTVEDVRVKTSIIPVMVEPSLGVEVDPPDGWTSWIDQLTNLAAVTEQHAANAAESAENAGDSATDAQRYATDAGDAKTAAVAAAEAAAASASHYPQIVDGVWYVWSPTAGVYVSTGIDAQGEDGVSPTVEVTAIQGGHRVVITDAEGPHTFDVLDGVTQDLSAYRTAAEQDVIDDAQDEELNNLKSAIDEIVDVVLPRELEISEALVFYPFALNNGDTIVVESKNGAYSNAWALLFYADDKTTILQASNDFQPSETVKEVDITASGIAYIRPNGSFSGDAIISVAGGDSLVEKVAENTVDIASNTAAIDQNSQEISNVKYGKNNLYDGIALISGRVFQGVYSDSITTVHCTDYLSITPGRIYAIYGGFFDQNYSNYYDKNKVYKGSLPLDGLNTRYPYGGSYNFLLFTAPSDAAYTRINYFNSDLIDGTDIRPEWYFRDVTDLVWAKKKILVIGDSISTDVYGNYKKWVTDLQDDGFISNGLVNNNSQHATGFAATYSGQANTTFLARLTAVGDLTGFDAIITFGGINDWIQSIDFDTFKAAVDSYFAYLIENATQARIIVFSPLHTALYGTTNSAGKTQKDYDDYIKSVAKDYAFPCLNLTDESGFCPDKSATFSDMWTLLPAGFSDHDGVHPIAEWEKNFLAPMIKGFLETIG